ncbi:MAG: hypothetical protein HWN67_04755 [Candidatus Helarchaeota archaeon]|nr:hypothetical protein [Candidatus Helarchaeota archaeon]
MTWSKIDCIFMIYTLIYLQFFFISSSLDLLISDYSLNWGMILAFSSGTGKFEFLILHGYLMNLSWPNELWWSLLQILITFFPNEFWLHLSLILIVLIIDIVIITLISRKVRKNGFEKDITSKEGLMFFIISLLIAIFQFYFIFFIGPKKLFTFLKLFLCIPYLIVSFIFIFTGIFYYFKKD